LYKKGGTYPMNYYNPYYQDRINEQQEFSRQGRTFYFDLKRSGKFDALLSLPGVVNSWSKVFVSICEISIVGGQVKPILGDATMHVYNVVPQDDGTIQVRGFVDFGEPLNVRLSVLVM